MSNYYLGIDVSKGYADFIVCDEKKKPIDDGFQLDDTFAGHHQLYSRLAEFLATHPKAKIHAAVESIGGYENKWFNVLYKYQAALNLVVARINPHGVQMNSKADLKRIKTDRISAVSIAEYLIAHPEKVNYQREDYFAPLRRQWTLIQLLVKQKTQLLNQLESLLYIANTEILTHCRDGVRLWTLRLLKQYPTARHLAKAKVSSLCKIPYLGQELAQKIIEQAKTSVSSSVDDITADTVRCLV